MIWSQTHAASPHPNIPAAPESGINVCGGAMIRVWSSDSNQRLRGAMIEGLELRFELTGLELRWVKRETTGERKPVLGSAHLVCSQVSLCLYLCLPLRLGVCVCVRARSLSVAECVAVWLCPAVRVER
eukprot:2650893-Rhodomonas_salina.1